MSLTKKDIVDAVSDSLGYEKKKATGLVEMLIELIKGSLEAGDDVLLSGFGKFCVKEKSNRLGRNPATGKSMILRSRQVVTFKSSGGLRDKINGRD